jgi:hypothetical protein
MKTDKKIIQDVREYIAQQAQDWINRHAPYYMKQNADYNKLSPSEFIKTKQKFRLGKKHPFEHQDNNENFSARSQKFETKNIKEIIQENKKLVILGDPGFGKTTLLNYLAFEYAKDESKPIPILLELKNYRHRYSLEVYIKNYTTIDIQRHKEENFIFLLDGFNELSYEEQSELYIDIDKLVFDFPESSFIISSRKVSYPSGLSDWITCEILELENIERRYLYELLGEKKTDTVLKSIKDTVLFDIVNIPLFLNFIIELYNAGRSIPKTEGGLLNEIFRYKYLDGFTLIGKERVKYVSMLKNLGGSMFCLQIISKLAYNILKETDDIIFDETFLHNFLENEASQNKWKIISIFEQMNLIEKFEFRDKNGETITLYSFWHQIFFDYFCGVYLKDLFENITYETILETALPFFEYKHWDESMKIALALTKEDTSNELFIQALNKDISLALTYIDSVENKLFHHTKELFEKQLDFYTSNPNYETLEFIFYEMGKCKSNLITSYTIKYIKKNLLKKNSDFVKEGKGNFVKKDCGNHRYEFAFNSLSMIGNKEGIDFLLNMTNHSNYSVRSRALSALRDCNDITIIPLLIEELKKEKNDLTLTSQMLLQKLDRIGGAELSEYAQNLVIKIRDANFKDITVTSEIDIPDVSSDLLYLKALLKYNYYSARRFCCASLMKIGNKAAFRLVVKNIEKLIDIYQFSDKWSEFAKKSNGLKYLTPRELSIFKKQLIKCIQSDSENAQLNTITILFYVFRSDFFKIVTKYFKILLPKVQESIMDDLPWLESCNASIAAPLSKLFKKPEISLKAKRGIIKILRNLRDSETSEFFNELIRHNDWLIKLYSLEMLDKKNNPETLHLYEELLIKITDAYIYMHLYEFYEFDSMGDIKNTHNLPELILKILLFDEDAMEIKGPYFTISPDLFYISIAIAKGLNGLSDTAFKNNLIKKLVDVKGKIYEQSEWISDFLILQDETGRRLIYTEKQDNLHKNEISDYNVSPNNLEASVSEKTILTFTESKLKTSGGTSNKTYPIVLLENIILKKRIHWLWGFVIFGKWTCGKIPKKTPRDRFFNYISKEIKEFEKYGLKIDLNRAGDEMWIEDFKTIKSKVKCNLFEAVDNYDKAVIEFEAGNIVEAIKKLESAISPPNYSKIKYINAYNLLIRCVSKVNYQNISERLLDKIKTFLRWYVKRLKLALYVIKNIYTQKNIISDSEIESELRIIEIEFNGAKKNFNAITDKVPVTSAERSFDELIELFQSSKEKYEKIIEIDGYQEEMIYEIPEFNTLRNNEIIKKLFKNNIGGLRTIKAYLTDIDGTESFLLFNIIKKGIDTDKSYDTPLLLKYLSSKLKYQIIRITHPGKQLSQEKTGYDVDNIRISNGGRKIPSKRIKE